MELKITHLDKERNFELDNLAKEKFNEHIVKHFDLARDQVDANLTIAHASKENNVTLHFHYRKNHTHLHGSGENLFKSVAHVIEELERGIMKNKMKKRRNHRSKLGSIARSEQDVIDD